MLILQKITVFKIKYSKEIDEIMKTDMIENIDAFLGLLGVEGKINYEYGNTMLDFLRNTVSPFLSWF